MEDKITKIVDFYFTNSLDELNSVKDILESNNIPNEIIRNNNNHPYFGINTAIGIEKNLYNYVVRIPEKYIDNAEYLISGESSNQEIVNEHETETSDETKMPDIEEKELTDLKVGYFVILLFFTHYSRYFCSLKKIKQNKKKRIILRIVGFFYLVLSFGLLLISAALLSGSFIFGVYISVLLTALIQTILNLIDFIIERQRLQKYLFIFLGLITGLLIFNYEAIIMLGF